MIKILLGTTNPSKKEKLSWLFDDFDSFKLLSTEDEKLDLNIEETGKNFEENAIIKAIAYSSAFAGYAVSSDGGASIPALGNNWNELLTHRFAGNNATEIDRLNLMIKIMEPYENEDRLVFWNEAIALAYKGKLIFSFLQTGERGYLQKEYNKNSIMPGFWLANLWFCPSFNKTYSELTEEQRRHNDFAWTRIKEKFITLMRSANLQ